MPGGVPSPGLASSPPIAGGASGMKVVEKLSADAVLPKVGAPKLFRTTDQIIAIGASLLAAGADYLETVTLLALTQTLDAPGGLLQYSQLGAWSKFALLAAHAVFCAGICYTSEKPRYILGAILLLPPFGVAAAAYDHIALSNVMGAGFAVAWVALLAMAIVSVVRAKGARA